MVPSIKLFVILGTQKFPFNRLIKALDELIEKGIYQPEEILIQSAYFASVPQRAKYCNLLPLSEFTSLIKDVPVIITHAGVNSILTCMQQNKHFLIIPRLKQYGEHVDNHQKEIAQVMKEQFDALVLEDITNLENSIQEASHRTCKPWIHNNKKLLASLIEYLED